MVQSEVPNRNALFCPACGLKADREQPFSSRSTLRYYLCPKNHQWCADPYMGVERRRVTRLDERWDDIETWIAISERIDRQIARLP